MTIRSIVDFSQETDLANNPRLIRYNIDMGAYEYPYIIDIIPDTNGIIYVNKSIVCETQSGNSWSNAIQELADALQAAVESNAVKPDSIRQIWVAAADYYPLYNAADDSTENGGRDNAFVMVKNVQIYGGFPDTANDIYNAPNSFLSIAQARNTRNWRLNSTVLSGDIGIVGDSTDNCYHVVISAGDVGTACLDGFTVTKGNANATSNSSSIMVNGQSVYRGRGGGVYALYSSPSLRHLIIDTNWAYYDGGGIYNRYASPEITNVLIAKNQANSGGGMYNDTFSSATLTNVAVSGNSAVSDGGGMYNSALSSPVLTDVLISENIAGNSGGGM
jgi:hypothetical protein